MKIWGLLIILGWSGFFLLAGCHLKSEEELKKEVEEAEELERYKKQVSERTEAFLVQQREEQKKAELLLQEKQAQAQREYQALLDASEQVRQKYLKEEALRVERARKNQLEIAKQKTEYDIDLEATGSFPWEENFEVALQKALSSGKAGLMLYFCRKDETNCLQLEKQAFRNRFFIDVLQQNFVPIKITLAENSEAVPEPFTSFYPTSVSPPVLQFVSPFLLFNPKAAIIGTQATPELIRLMESQVKEIEEINTQYSYLSQKVQEESSPPESLLQFANLLSAYGRGEEACLYYTKGIDFLKSSYDHEHDCIQAILCFIHCGRVSELEILLSIFQENYVDSHQQSEICYKVGQFFQKYSPEKMRKWFLLGLKYPDPEGEWHPKIQQALEEFK